MATTYLTGFANSNGAVIMRRRDGQEKPVVIGDATIRRDFYTFVDNDGNPNEDVEDWMAIHVEGPVTDPLIRCRAGLQPAPDDIPALARFVAVSLLRTATVRSHLEQIDAHLLPTFMLGELAKEHDIDLPSLPEREKQRLLKIVADILEAPEGDDDRRRQSDLRIFLRKVDEFTTAVEGWAWRLDEADDPCLLTADAPVATLTSTPVEGWAGILPADSTIALPVSPTQLLLASPGPLFGQSTVSPQFARRVNEELCRNAYDAVYRHTDMTWPQDLHLAKMRPTLRTPRTTFERSEPGSRPTFPLKYPQIADTRIAALLEKLGAADTVD